MLLPAPANFGGSISTSLHIPWSNGQKYENSSNLNTRNMETQVISIEALTCCPHIGQQYAVHHGKVGVNKASEVVQNSHVQKQVIP